MSAETDRQQSVDKAISAVLDAEQEALARIRECDARADEITRNAREAVRRMLRDTDRRISRLHANCERRTRELIDELEGLGAADASLKTGRPGGDNFVSAAVEATAFFLTTSDADDVD
jgi:hypothetical protein